MVVNVGTVRALNATSKLDVWSIVTAVFAHTRHVVPGFCSLFVLYANLRPMYAVQLNCK